MVNNDGLKGDPDDDGFFMDDQEGADGGKTDGDVTDGTNAIAVGGGQQFYGGKKKKKAYLPATEGVKNAYYSAAGSNRMLVACIAVTADFVISAIYYMLIGILSTIFLLMLTIGFWITYANAKNRKLKSFGIRLLRFGYVEIFGFAIGFTYMGGVILWAMTANIALVVMETAWLFIICISYSRVIKMLNMGKYINANKAVAETHGSAAILLIIGAAATFAIRIMRFLYQNTLESINTGNDKTLKTTLRLVIQFIFGSDNIMGIVAAAFSLCASICAATVLMAFNKNLKEEFGSASE